MAEESDPEVPNGNGKRPAGPTSGLVYGGRQKWTKTHPLVHVGRHFCRTVIMLPDTRSLLLNGIEFLQDKGATPAEDYTHSYVFSLGISLTHALMNDSARREQTIFKALLERVPGLQEQLLDAGAEEFGIITEAVRAPFNVLGLYLLQKLRKGIAGARSDDSKSIKGDLITWLVPTNEDRLIPPLNHSQKCLRGFHHPRTGMLLCPVDLDWGDADIRSKLDDGSLAPTGDQWPLFIYENETYDPSDGWSGFLRGVLLVKAYKQIFLSPSSVEHTDRSKSSRVGNARLHGMKCVNVPSIAYIATQVRFTLSSASTFARSDEVSDSGRFYDNLMEFLLQPDEQEEVAELLVWWNRPVPAHWASSKMKAQRLAKNALKAAEAAEVAAGASTAEAAAAAGESTVDAAAGASTADAAAAAGTGAAMAVAGGAAPRAVGE
ncbi:hypothetical protein HWV62_32152 [Athelia sp. TMB]|nr:hypothetical protein HWV62_32152 [Athelia sp. TMB]